MFFIIILLQGCSFLNYGIEKEYDEVKSTTRITKSFVPRDAVKFFSPLNEVHQTILKEIDSEGDITYTAFDVLSMKSNSYQLEKEVYIIIDGEVREMDVKRMKSEKSFSITEDEETVITADSSSVSVVTGYNKYESRKVKLQYAIDNDVIDMIRGAEDVRFRYYAGPDMITVRVYRSQLKRFKKLIEYQ
ncbi:MAG TPA: hypothetical protein VJ909_09165 [Prolixibacteraceae bacterium]|nr:hypothetical protein [Prolixibacteraceae bacterium]